MGQITRWGFDRKAGASLPAYPLVRPTAAPFGFPYRQHRTMDVVLADEIQSSAAVLTGTETPPSTDAARTCYTPQPRKRTASRAVAKPDASLANAELAAGPALDISQSPRGFMSADSSGGCEGSAPEGTGGAAAMRLQDPANAEQPNRKIPQPAVTPAPPPVAPVEPVRAAPPVDHPIEPEPAGRAVCVEVREEPDLGMGATGGGSAAHFDQNARFAKARPPVDMARFRAALADQAKVRARSAAPSPIERATSREECRRCGVPGFKGCEHQLPYEAPGPETEPYSYASDVRRYSDSNRFGNQRKATAR